MGQWPLKWIPNGLPNCPWLIWVHFLTFWSITALIYKRNTNYPNMWNLAIFDILTLITSTDRTRPFSNDLVIFLSIPHVGWLRKINKPWKKCIVWLFEVIKVTCIFFRILGSKFWKLLKLPKIIMVAQKTLKSSQNYPYLISPIDETTEKHVFLPQKGHICQIDQIGKGRETLLHGVYGSTVKNSTLTFGSKIFSWLPNMYWDSQKKIGRKTQC